MTEQNEARKLSDGAILWGRFCDSTDDSEKETILKELYPDATSKELDFLMGRISSLDSCDSLSPQEREWEKMLYTSTNPHEIMEMSKKMHGRFTMERAKELAELNVREQELLSQ